MGIPANRVRTMTSYNTENSGNSVYDKSIRLEVTVACSSDKIILVSSKTSDTY